MSLDKNTEKLPCHGICCICMCLLCVLIFRVNSGHNISLWCRCTGHNMLRYQGQDGKTEVVKLERCFSFWSNISPLAKKGKNLGSEASGGWLWQHQHFSFLQSTRHICVQFCTLLITVCKGRRSGKTCPVLGSKEPSPKIHSCRRGFF